MEARILKVFLLNFLASFIAISQCNVQASPLKNQKYFRKVPSDGETLPEEDIVSSYAVHSKVECSLKCLQTSTCVGYNYRSKSNKYVVNCQLSNKTRRRDQESNAKGKWKFFQVLETIYKPPSQPGCTDGKALGMENAVIRDSQITASSEFSPNHQASNGRLNFKANSGAWSAKTNDLNQWLQVDFLRPTIITGITTQGRIQYNQFVTNYTVSFSEDENNFQNFNNQGMLKVFQGNDDVNSTVYHDIAPAITARFIRVHPTSWAIHISMRVEFHGCFI